MRPMHRSLHIRLLLVFALLFGQLGGLAHGIAHALAGQAPPSSLQDQSLPHDRLCDLCASYAQLGSALGGSIPRLVAGITHTAFIVPAYPAFSSSPFYAFAARAPPLSA